VTLFGAVAASVWFGGWRAALLSALIGYFVADYLFIPPRYELRLDSSVLAGLIGYSLSCAVIIYLGERMRGARERLKREFAQRQRVEQTVEEREQQLRVITDATPALISYIDRDQRYRFVNREYERWFGQPREAVIGKTMNEVLGDSVMQQLRPHVEAVLHGQDVRFEIETAYRDGGTRWIDAHYVPDLSASGEVAGFFLLVLDISERKRSEATLAEAVRQQQLLYRFLERRQAANSLGDLYDAALDAIEEALLSDRASILLLDDTQKMRFVAWRGLSDDYRKAVDGHTAWAEDDPEPRVIRVDDVTAAEMDDSLRAVVKAEGIGALAFIPLVSKGMLIGKFMVYFNRAHRFTDDEVKISLSIARQIALGIERQLSEEALRESEERYRAVVESQVEMLCRFRRDGTILFVNDAYARARGTAPEALIRQNFWEFVDQRDRAAIEATLARLTPESPQVRIENRFATTEGYRWHLWTNRALKFDNAGRWVEAQSSGIDITERVQAEQALRHSEARLRNIFEAVRVSIWEEDFTSVKAEIDLLAAAGVSDFRRYFAEHPEFVERAIDLVKIRDVNPATLRMFGARDRAEMLQSLKTVFVPESRTVFVEELITIAAKRQFLEAETVVQTLAGEPLDIAFTVSFPPHDQPYDRVLVTVLDITERKRAGDILRQSEERFRLVANNSQILIWLTDSTGKMQFVNRAHRDFFGIARDPSEFDWNQFIHPEDRQHYMEEFTSALRRRRDFQCRARMRRSDGQMRWIESRANAISDSAGLRGYVGSSVDITDIYESEQKLREIDQRKDEFLANMSHEIRSPLTGIMGYADILLTKLKDPEDLAYVKTIKESGEYLIEIVNDILDLSKIEAGKLLLHIEPISLHSVLAEVQGLMSARAREKDLALTLRYDGAVPETIETDRTRLRQILINLVSNAIKFTERGRIEIVVRWVHGTESAGGTNGPAATAAVQFEVIDTGIGIAPEHKDILFQPFTQADTTTTRAYEGTGLGLTITRRLLEMLKGQPFV
jgi:PAS domain S-box-containing protein